MKNHSQYFPGEPDKGNQCRMENILLRISWHWAIVAQRSIVEVCCVERVLTTQSTVHTLSRMFRGMSWPRYLRISPRGCDKSRYMLYVLFRHPALVEEFNFRVVSWEMNNDTPELRRSLADSVRAAYIFSFNINSLFFLNEIHSQDIRIFTAISSHVIAYRYTIHISVCKFGE